MLGQHLPTGPAHEEGGRHRPRAAPQPADPQTPSGRASRAQPPFLASLLSQAERQGRMGSQAHRVSLGDTWSRRVHPDIASERHRQAFDVERLTNLLDEGVQNTALRREIGERPRLLCRHKFCLSSFLSSFLVCFFQYSGLNSGPLHGATSSAVFFIFYFETGYC